MQYDIEFEDHLYREVHAGGGKADALPWCPDWWVWILGGNTDEVNLEDVHFSRRDYCHTPIQNFVPNGQNVVIQRFKDARKPSIKVMSGTFTRVRSICSENLPDFDTHLEAVKKDRIEL